MGETNKGIHRLARFKQHVEKFCRKMMWKDGRRKIAMHVTLKAGVTLIFDYREVDNNILPLNYMHKLNFTSRLLDLNWNSSLILLNLLGSRFVANLWRKCSYSTRNDPHANINFVLFFFWISEFFEKKKLKNWPRPRTRVGVLPTPIAESFISKTKCEGKNNKIITLWR